MILKTCFLLVLCLTLEVLGASFSKVYVQSGPEAEPVANYYTEFPHSVPAYDYGSPQLGQLAAAPVGSEYPTNYAYETRCTSSSCVYPGQTVASVASNANIFEYLQSPVSSVPLVYSPVQNEPTGYKYSYVLVDQYSGAKVHNAFTEGAVIHKEYPVLQPEVVYVADNMKGFDAFVKNFLPVEEVKHTETVHHTPLCVDVKSEALTAHEDHEHYEEHEPSHDHEAYENHEGHEHHEEPTHHESHETHEHPEGLEEHEHHGANEPHEGHDHHEDLKAHEYHEEHKHQEPHEHHESQGKHAGPQELSEEMDHKIHDVMMRINDEIEPTHEKLIEIHHAITHEHEAHPVPHHEQVEHHTEPEGHQAASQEHAVVDGNAFVLYNDVIKCIQAAMAKVNNHPSVPKPSSPLTYLIFNKPC